MATDRPGRLCYDISYSPTVPELFYFASNDGNLPSDGFLALCGNDIVPVDYEPDGVGQDGRPTFGVVMNPYSVWPKDGGHDYVWGVTKHPNFVPAFWMLVEMDPGEDVCQATPSSPPDRVKEILIWAPEDNFLSTGRSYYGGGEVSLDYDAHTEIELLFANHHGTPAGIIVEDRAELEARLASTTNEGPIAAGVGNLRELLTHPEFAHVYNDQTPPENWLGAPTQENPYATGLVGRVNTSFPRLALIPAPTESEDEEHWILAVPCAAVQLPPDLPTFTNDQFGEYEPDWAPDAEFDVNYDHSMVRVFDVHDGNAVTNPSTPLPDYTLIGPRPETAATRIEPQVWDGRNYLFVTDFGGSVQVWDVTELLDEPPGRIITPGDTEDYLDFFIEEWLAPPCVSDDIGNNVWSIAVDPVTWTGCGGTCDELYVYVLFGRVGIEVLRFDPSASFGERLQPVRRIEIPYGQGGLCRWISPDDEADRLLFVADSLNGIRVFSYQNHE